MHMNALILGDWSFTEAWENNYSYSYDASFAVDGWLLIYQDRLEDSQGKILVLSQLTWKLICLV